MNIIPDDTQASSLRVETVEDEAPDLCQRPVVDDQEEDTKGQFVCNVEDLKTATKLAFKATLEDPVVIPMPDGYANKAINPDTGKLAEYPELLKSSKGDVWRNGMCNELGRLFQGYEPNGIEGTNTCTWIHPNDMPKGRTATYLRVVVADRPMKKEPERVRITVGGDKVDYPGPVTTKTTDLTTAKLLINSVISDDGARFLGLDLKDFFLGTPLPRTEYAKIPVHLVPDEILDYYNIRHLIVNNYLWIAIDRGMYGLPQASRIAYEHLVPKLEAAGYTEAGITPGLFKHKDNGILFCLTVDDFGVKYKTKESAHHLIDTLKKDYVVAEDWEGSRYCGMDLDWNYEKGYVDLSMKGYVKKALARFQHPKPVRPQHSPSKWTPPDYGAKVQYATPEDDSRTLQKVEIKWLQETIGVFLFYARAVDNTMLVALGTLASEQANGTEKTKEAAIQFLNYAATHPDAKVRFHKSEMQLHIHSDASYLSEPKARSRAGGFFFLDGKDDPRPNSPPPPVNGPAHILCENES